METKVHHGRNIKRLREMLGIKQEAIAFDLGLSQATVSDYEQKEVLDEKVLEKVSQALKVPVEAITNMSDDAVHSYINTFNNNDNAVYNFQHYTFNPIEKIVELYNEKEALYERMLKEKDSLLEKFLNK